MTPAHAFGQQDPAHLGPGDVDAGRPGHGGQRVQGPHRRTGRVAGGELAGAVADQPARRRAGHQGDQLGALVLADAGFASGAGPVAEPVEPLGGEAGQPLAHRLRTTAQCFGDGRHPQSVPGQDDHLCPTDPIRRSVPRSGQLADLALLDHIHRRASKHAASAWSITSVVPTSGRLIQPHIEERSTRRLLKN